MTIKELLGDAYRDGMSMDDVNNALANVIIPDASEYNRLKDAVSRANTEAADRKRELRAQKDEAAKADNEWQRKYSDLETKMNGIVREGNINKNAARLVSIGYDEKLAAETAMAMVDGDIEKVINNQRAYIEAHDKAVLAEKMRSTPRPNAGGGTGSLVDYNKRIADATNSGDYALAAALIRQQSEANQT